LIFLGIICFSSALPHPRLFRTQTIDDQKLELSLDRNNHFFTQNLDHFDRQNLETFEHRYFVNESYWKPEDPTSPVFLCVGGEGPPLNWEVLVSSDHCNDMVELAASTGALLLALEHRYYGLSIPNHSLETDNLKWLTSEQALEDIASFHKHISSEYGLNEDGASRKWVSWGGSYPGMISGLARLRFPHLFHASLSSSSPLQAKINMEGYNDVVANSMTLESVGGSQACLDVIVNGHEQIGEKLTTQDGKESLATTFNLCNGADGIETKRDQSTFCGDGVVYLPVQSNDPASETPLSNIADICSFLLDPSRADETDMEKLSDLASIQNAGTCMSTSFQATIDFYSIPNNPSRSWLYQTCTEWGFYQTCDSGSSCPYTQGLHTVDQDLEICSKVFGLNPLSVSKNILFSNDEFGGANIQVVVLFNI